MIMYTVKINIVLFFIGLKVSVGATDIRDIPGEYHTLNPSLRACFPLDQRSESLEIVEYERTWVMKEELRVREPCSNESGYLQSIFSGGCLQTDARW